MNDDKYKIIFIIGPPGVGKNTQCDFLIEKYKFIHIGAGDLLRAEAKRDTEDGKLISQSFLDSKIVPVRITCGLIKKAMDNQGKDKIFLIDGYPRNQANIDGWKEVFINNFQLVCSIILDCDEEILTQRLLERGKTSGRIDDTIEIIKKRFKTHYAESDPIIPQLKKMGPYIQLKAAGTPEEVFALITKDLGKLIDK